MTVYLLLLIPLKINALRILNHKNKFIKNSKSKGLFIRSNKTSMYSRDEHDSEIRTPYECYVQFRMGGGGPFKTLYNTLIISS